MHRSILENASIVGSTSTELSIGYGKRSWNRQPSNQITPFYFPDFFLSHPHPWTTHEHYTEITIDELLQLFSKPLIQSAIKWTAPCKESFAKTFHDLQSKFANNELIKAVPFVFETTTQQMTPTILAWALHSILKYTQNNPVTLYGFWDKDHGMLGATPETLFTLENFTQLKTMACAGTARNQEQLQHFLHNPKETLEHQYVVDGIKLALSPYGHVKIGSQEILSLPNLSHLLTPITATLNSQVPYSTLVEALHPTPALGAFPKQSGQKWLNNYQTIIDRQRFGAPIGIKTQSRAECYVAIRNIQWGPKGIKIGAGCGVVQESDLENEWQEIQAKIEAIKNMMGL